MTVRATSMVATSQPLATQAGLRMLERGGNAVDAAITAAAVLAVTEPMSTGVGGDMFAMVWRAGEVTAIDAAGPAPAKVDRPAPVAVRGPRSVTVPGAVAGWAALSARCGRRGRAECLAAAIDIARRGFPVGPRTAHLWETADVRPAIDNAELAGTLERIADQGPGAFYDGEVARAITAASWLDPTDLLGYEPRWVQPLRLTYRDTEVLELPPPTQGVAALEGLGILQQLRPYKGAWPLCTVDQMRAARLALEDAYAHVRDGADVAWLLGREHLERRSREPVARATDVEGGTVHLCVVDEDRMAVSLIQSLFEHFGSGVVAPGTGVVLNNRAAGFAVEGAVTAGRRPFHTIIPGLLLRDGDLLGPFGITGGSMQAQAHMQFVASVVDDGLDPQAALDRPRFRVDGDTVALEEGLGDVADAAREAGLEPRKETSFVPFGAGQAIFVDGDELLGGSDSRRDGCAAGL